MSNLAPLPISVENGWEYGYLNTSGNVTTSGSVDNGMVSPFIEIQPEKKYVIAPDYTLPSQYSGWLAYVQYNENKTRVGSRSTVSSSTSAIPTANITTRSDAKYIRVCASNLYNDENASMIVESPVYWKMDSDSNPVPIQSLSKATGGFTKPYPASLWRIDENNGGYPYTALMPDILYYEPEPPAPPSPTIDPLEFYDEYNDEYLFALNQKHRRYKLRVELLGYYENVIGEITKDVSLDASGQININNEQITRRSCTLSLINVDKEYLPSPDNPIWVNRKFKLWIGAVIGDKTYWWSQGVYYTQSVTNDGNIVNVQGVDKGGALDGTIKTGMLDTTYIVEANTTIANLIRDTLMWNESNSPYLRRNTRASSYPIDPIAPIIGTRFNTYRTQNEISLNGNDYISTLFSSLADGYGADAYYNTNGRFVFQQMADDNRIDGYRFMAHQWDFSDTDSFYCDSSVEYNFDGYNVVTVYTNESDIINVSYTAANNNPLSPLRLDAAGVRRMSDVEIPYVNVSQDEMESRCKAYADYLLMKESMRGMSISFSCPIIPHLDVNRTIGITDKRFNLSDDTFVINSITIPLSAEAMQINATKVSWLPDNTTIEG